MNHHTEEFAAKVACVRGWFAETDDARLGARFGRVAAALRAGLASEAMLGGAQVMFEDYAAVRLVRAGDDAGAAASASEGGVMPAGGKHEGGDVGVHHQRLGCHALD